MDLWLFNTQADGEHITLWCLDDEGTHHSVDIKAPASFCVLTPDADTSMRLLQAIDTIMRLKNCSITGKKEHNATVDQTEAKMMRLTVPAKHQKDIESYLSSSFQLYDTGSSPLQHLFRDGLSCNTWVRFTNTQRIKDLPHHDKRFRCRLQDLDWKMHAERKSLPRVVKGMGFDIETAPKQEGSRISFSDQDPVAVIQLSTFKMGDSRIMAEYQQAMKERDQPKRQRELRTLPIETHVFAVGSATTQEDLDREIDPAQVQLRRVYFFPTEIEMMWAAQEFILNYKPVFIISYNGNQFDFPMCCTSTKNIMERKKDIRRFAPSGADPFQPLEERKQANPMVWSLCNKPIEVRKQTIKTAQAGTRHKFQLKNCNSFISIDLFIYCLEYQNSLTQYTLNNVVQTFLKMQKVDVGHDLIAPLLNGNDASRRKLIVYGAVDAELTVVLSEKLQVLAFYGGLACVAGPSIGAIQGHGQQHLIKAAFMRECVSSDPRLMLDYDTGSRPWFYDEQCYKGATVVTPALGLHRRFVATLDFASLYPSIMISHNICKTSQRGPVEQACPDNCHEVFVYESPYDKDRNQALERNVIKKESKAKSQTQGSADIRMFMKRAPSSSSGSEGDSPVFAAPARSSSYRDMPTVLDALKDPDLELGTDTYPVSLDPPCYFTNPDAFEGTSVRALKKLAVYRKQEKKKMAIAYAEGRNEDGAVHNGLQLAYKVVMNSLYGFFGARSNSFYCKQVAASVTATGRGMLMHVISIAHRYASFLLKDGSFIHCYLPRKPTREEGGGPIEWFSFTPTGECVPRECGPDPSQVKHQTAHSVVYGDTDSVFVKLDLTGEDFPLDSVTERLDSHNPTKEYFNPLCYEAILLCEHMCKSVNRFFKAVCGESSTIDLSYEKLWLRLCLQDKKKYSGLRCDEILDRKTGALQYPYQKQVSEGDARVKYVPC